MRTIKGLLLQMKLGQSVEERIAAEEALISMLEDAQEAVFDCFNQACSGPETEYGKYDHMCLSAYENAQDLLIQWGKIKPTECQRK